MEKDKMEQLVEQAIKNDENAFNELYIHFYPSIYKTAMKLCRNDADAKDVAQLTFLQMRKSIHTLEKPNYFPLWLHRICVNKCKNLFRDNHSDPFDDEYYAISNLVVESRTDYISDQRMRFLSDQKVLFTLMKELKPEHMEVLEMTYFKQMSLEEIAYVLQIPLGTVKSRLFAARKGLKEKICAYEKKEGISLNFHMHSLVPLIMAMHLTKQEQLLSTQMLKTNGKVKQRRLTRKEKGLVMASVMVVTLLGGTIIHHFTDSSSPKSNIITENHDQFPTIYIDNYMIENAQDGYYYLRGCAYDEKALKKLSSQTIKEMEPLYQAMKQYGSVYYDTLKTSGWCTAYEAIMLMQ